MTDKHNGNGKDRKTMIAAAAIIILVLAAAAAVLLRNHRAREAADTANTADTADTVEGLEETSGREAALGTEPEGTQPGGAQASETGENLEDSLSGGIEQGILKGRVQVWDLTDIDDDTAYALDLNSDSKRERISIKPETDDDNYFAEYTLEVNGSACEGTAENMEPSLLALSLDGKNILLAVFEEGPSGDPETNFYYYNGDKLSYAGEIPGDIRTLERDEEGYIRCGFRADVMQSAYAWGYWYWDGSQVVKREDEEYICVNNREDWSGTEPENSVWMMLKEPVPLYAERGEDSQSVMLKPQKVMELKTDAREWSYLKGEDGTEGWLHVADFCVPALDNKNVADVFEGCQAFD